MTNAVYAGIRVVEIASGIAAPYATMFLADHGADVIKVEGPEGDWYRSEPGFLTINRNKRSVVVDDPTDLDRLADLLGSADVVVVDHPGMAERLSEIAPGAVVMSMTAWGESSSKSGQAASPALVAAATGVAWNQISYGDVPVHVVVPITSYGTAVLGALAMAAGLYARERDGRGAVYEVSEVAGSAAIQIGDTRLADDAPERPGSSVLGSRGRVPCYCLFEAGDSKWLFVACGTSAFYERLVRLIDRADLLDHPDLPSPPWGLLNDEAIAVLSPILQEAFAGHPRSWWLDQLRSADIPAQPVLTREEYLETSIVRENNLHVAVPHDELVDLRMMGLPLLMSETPGLIRHAAPTLGDHRIEDIVAEASGSVSEAPNSADQANAVRSPLDGVRVIDLSSFIAGPVISRHLAMLGADVVKVEAPTGDPFRGIGPMFANWNQGKRSIALDLRDSADQAVLHQLARASDCVIENFRPGVADRLAVDASTLRSHNDELILLAAPGYGTDPSMADAAAFDPLLQALGGIMAAQGGDSDPVFLTVPIHDVVTPMIGAFGLVSGLFHRLRTGTPQDVLTSLAHTVMTVQVAEYTSYEGAPDSPQGGFDHPGDGDRIGWRESDDELLFFDGDDEVAIAKHGFVNTELARENGLLVTHDHPQFGPMTQVGQLVQGAGPAPGRAPAIGEHSEEIRTELLDS